MTDFRIGDRIVHDAYGSGTIYSTWINNLGQHCYEAVFPAIGGAVTIVGEKMLRKTEDPFKAFVKTINKSDMGRISPLLDDKKIEKKEEDKMTIKNTQKNTNKKQADTPKFQEVPENVKKHREIVLKLNEIYAKKNADYGDSFNQMYKEEGLAAARLHLTEKLARFKQLSKSGVAQVKSESMIDSLWDMANYAVMTSMILMEEEEKKKATA